MGGLTVTLDESVTASWVVSESVEDSGGVHDLMAGLSANSRGPGFDFDCDVALFVDGTVVVCVCAGR